MSENCAEVLAVIPARGGSKGIPRKNIRPFAGHPLVAYSIAAGLQAKLVTRVVVSTDDEEIAAVSRRYGAEVPFLRPAELAQDQSADQPFMQHALAWLAEREDYHPEVVVQLRPTSPVRPKTCVDDAVRLLLEHPQADSVRGVVPSGQNPYKMWRLDEAGFMTPLLQADGLAEPYNAPRQALPQTYWQTGHVDAIRVSMIFEKNSLSGDRIFPLLLDPRYTVDIDNLNDWRRAEWLVYQGAAAMGFDMVYPGPKPRPLPEKVRLVVFDFDGVMTDDRVWIDENGRQQVAANRSDGMGLEMLQKKTAIEVMVLSKETNPVVTARCASLGIPVLQGIEEKASTLKALLVERHIDPHQVIYLGNDVNDVPCFEVVGCALVTADAHPAALRQADLVLQHCGGHGAVRELCDLLMEKQI